MTTTNARTCTTCNAPAVVVVSLEIDDQPVDWFLCPVHVAELHDNLASGSLTSVEVVHERPIALVPTQRKGAEA